MSSKGCAASAGVSVVATNNINIYTFIAVEALSLAHTQISFFSASVGWQLLP
jgi:hypothetical protein